MAEEKAEQAVEAAPKMGKSNLVLIVIITVLATVLVAGGVGVYIAMSSRGTDQGHEEASADTGADQGDSGKKDKGKKSDAPKGPAIYIGMEPPFVVNFDETQQSRFLQVTVQIMTRDPSTSQTIKDNEPVVRNDLLLLFSGQNSIQLGTREGKEELRKHALDTVRAIVKNEGGRPDFVENVYFTTFVMQ